MKKTQEKSRPDGNPPSPQHRCPTAIGLTGIPGPLFITPRAAPCMSNATKSSAMKPAYTIPTENKGKIPHTLSYPVGAELISTALQDVPQIKTLSISFFHYNRAKPPAAKVTLHPVLEAHYSYSRPTFSS